MNNVTEVITNYLSETLKVEKSKLNPDTQLLESGIMDSLAIVGLLSFLEEKFGITLVDNDFDIANFNTINDICSLIDSKTK